MIYSSDTPDDFMKETTNFTDPQLAERLRKLADESDSWTVDCALREAAHRLDATPRRIMPRRRMFNLNGGPDRRFRLTHEFDSLDVIVDARSGETPVPTWITGGDKNSVEVEFIEVPNTGVVVTVIAP